MEATTPPLLGENAVPAEVKWYVPRESVGLYSIAYDINVNKIHSSEDVSELDEAWKEPTVTIADGKICFDSEVEDAEYVYEIKDAMVVPQTVTKEKSVTMQNAYILTVHAKKGYTKSRIATVVIDKNMSKAKAVADVTGDGIVNIDDVTAVINVICGGE